MKLMTKLPYVVLCVAVLLGAQVVNAQNQTLTICEGTDENRNIPFYFYYLDDATTTSQVIYPATYLEEIKGKQITGIKFYNAGYPSAWNSSMAVSLGEVSFSELAEDNSGYIAADYKEVFTGAVSGDETTTTLEFAFSAPVVYTGQNLVIEVKNTEKGSTYMQVPFYGIDLTETINAVYGYSNSWKYNESFLPKVTFTYEDIPQYGANVSVESIDFATIFTDAVAESEFVISNTGLNDITATISGADAPFTLSKSQSTIASLASDTITVTFAPTADGAFSQVLSIDMGEAGVHEITLTGKSMTPPTGYSQAFDVADKTLPEEWIGWNVKGTYDYGVGDYVYESAESHTEYFVGREIDGVKAVAIYDDANPYREYPSKYDIYMISPKVNGNVMITARGTYSEYTTGEVLAYKAVMNADSTYTIDTTPIAVTWMPDFTNTEWCNGIFSLSEESHVAIFMTYSAVSAFAADELCTAPPVELPVGEEFVQDGVTYVVKENRTLGITAVSNDVTECNIPESITVDRIVYTVVAIEKDAFYWSNVTNVTLPATVTTIGYGAFRSSPLASINLPESITEIGEYAFYKTMLTSITLPQGVNEIKASTFAQCESLSEIVLPAGLQEIGQGAFYKCAITSIDIPDVCHTIDMYAFESCKNLSDITLPDALQVISMGLFRDCTSITQIEIPANVTTIEREAFQNVGISAIHFPASVTEIEANVFNDTQLTTISVDEANTTFTVIDGALYTADKEYIYLYPRITESKKYDIVEGCIAVWGGAFYGCDVTTVTFPDNFVGIDAFAFCYSQIESVELPHSISVIWEQAFAGTKLTSVVVPNGVTQLSEAVFASCENLASVTLPEGLTSVGNRVFYQCTALTEIVCLGMTPAEFEAWDTYTNPFFGIDYSLVTIKCPLDALVDYQMSEWGDFFTNIEGHDYSGIADNISHKCVVTASNGVITVDLGNDAACNITITDINGVVVSSAMNVQGTYVTDNMPRGIYIVAISNDKDTAVQKVVL